MTAGEPEGVGQQQRRECGLVFTSTNTWAAPPPTTAFCFLDAQHDGAHRNRMGVIWSEGAWSPTPPARDSGRDKAREFPNSFREPPSLDEAREAVARWLRGLGIAYGWMDGDAYRTRLADQLLALPELAALLRGVSR